NYIIFCTFYVSKRIMEMSVRFLDLYYDSMSNKNLLLKSLCRDIRDNVSIDRFIGFGLDIEFILFNICKHASQFDNLDILKYYIDLEGSNHSYVLYKACRYGSLECLRYICDNKSRDEIIEIYGAIKYSYYLNDHSYRLDVVKFICEKRSDSKFEDIFYMNPDICYNAASAGSLECLKYLHENGVPWDEETCFATARGSSLECLKYLHENGCPWDEETCLNAAEAGSLECLIYAHQNGCPWDKGTCSAAAEAGSLECLMYAHQNGAPW